MESPSAIHRYAVINYAVINYAAINYVEKLHGYPLCGINYADIKHTH